MFPIPFLLLLPLLANLPFSVELTLEDIRKFEALSNPSGSAEEPQSPNPPQVAGKAADNYGPLDAVFQPRPPFRKPEAGRSNPTPRLPAINPPRIACQTQLDEASRFVKQLSQENTKLSARHTVCSTSLVGFKLKFVRCQGELAASQNTPTSTCPTCSCPADLSADLALSERRLGDCGRKLAAAEELSSSFSDESAALKSQIASLSPFTIYYNLSHTDCPVLISYSATGYTGSTRFAIETCRHIQQLEQEVGLYQNICEYEAVERLKIIYLYLLRFVNSSGPIAIVGVGSASLV